MVTMWTSQCLNMILQISSFTPLYNMFSPINLNVVEIFYIIAPIQSCKVYRQYHSNEIQH
jgi:hypothetical protein